MHAFALQIGDGKSYDEVEVIVTWERPKLRDPWILEVTASGPRPVIQAKITEIYRATAAFLSAEFTTISMRDTPVLASA